MIPAKPTLFGRFFWQSFVSISLKRAFHEVVVEGVKEAPNSAVLLIGNHMSWWDGFFALYLNQTYFLKEYYVMMLEKELKKHPLMRRGGAYSIQPGSRSVVQSLAYTQSLLQKPQNLVTVFPQGKIHSLYDSEIRFQGGIGRMLDRMEEDIQVVFYAAHIDYGAHSKPTLYLRLAYFFPENTFEGALEDAYRKHYQDALKAQIAGFPI